MVGDLSDFMYRISVVLPKRWFSEQSPNLNALLAAIATPWVWLYSLIVYMINQTRLLTATEDWLDLISNDYFGVNLLRKSGEVDTAYRDRIQSALLREAATRSAVVSNLQNLTGTQPFIFEPANCLDTGSFGDPSSISSFGDTGMAYGMAGGWGSLLLPLQFFVTAFRPAMPGVGMLAGYGIPSGGFGVGVIGYVDLAMLPGAIDDADIQTTLSSLLPMNAVAWLRII
jgi:hypothetical protein